MNSDELLAANLKLGTLIVTTSNLEVRLSNMFQDWLLDKDEDIQPVIDYANRFVVFLKEIQHRTS